MNKSANPSLDPFRGRKVEEKPVLGSVRAQVSERTRSLHEALHVNPVLSRLEDANLTAAEYRQILDRYLSFYMAAESRRVALNAFPGQSLMSDICLLSADTGQIPEDLPRLQTIEDKWSCLGMLYVLHGARFGARIMVTKLRNKLPHLPHHFIGQDSNPNQWRLLVLQMERAAEAPARIDAMAHSAAETFSAFGDWALSAKLD